MILNCYYYKERIGDTLQEVEMKPFRGMYKDNEVKHYYEKYFGLCGNKGLVAHIEKNNPLPGMLPEAS